MEHICARLSISGLYLISLPMRKSIPVHQPLSQEKILCSRVWNFIKSQYKTLPNMGNFMKFHHGYLISYGKLVIPIMGMMHALISILGFKSHIHGL